MWLCPSAPWEGALHQHVCSIISMHTHAHTQLGPWLLAGASVFASGVSLQLACLCKRLLQPAVCVSVCLLVCVSVCLCVGLYCRRQEDATGRRVVKSTR